MYMSRSSLLDTTRLNAFVVLVGFIVAVILKLINLRFQKEGNSVFKDFPKTTKAIFAILMVLGSSFGIATWVVHKELSQAWAVRIIIAIAFACLFVASLASLLFPDALPSLGSCCQSLAHRIISHKLILHSLFARFQQFYSRRKPPLLPLTIFDTASPVSSTASPQY